MIQIALDRKHIAYRRDKTWEIAKRGDDNVYRTVERWEGSRRSLFHKMESYGIVPSREAEQALMAIPEQPAFRDDEPKTGRQADGKRSLGQAPAQGPKQAQGTDPGQEGQS